MSISWAKEESPTRPGRRGGVTAGDKGKHGQSSVVSPEPSASGNAADKQLEPGKRIKIFDISPNGRLIAAQMGNEIFIRIVNQVMRDQWHNTLDYQNSIAFLPLYLDEDYNFNLNRKKYSEFRRRETLRKSMSQGADPETP